eukprot:2873159-Rhodomonas_salina.1
MLSAFTPVPTLPSSGQLHWQRLNCRNARTLSCLSQSHVHAPAELASLQHPALPSRRISQIQSVAAKFRSVAAKSQKAWR